MANKISKRKFLKYGFLGSCACAMGVGKVQAINKLIISKFDDLGKWSKLSKYYIETPRGVKCLICPNECVLKEDEAGDCKSRINHEGKIYSIGYGNPCSLNVDPIEKKPLYHFLPESRTFSLAVAGCNLACLNCQNWQISQVSPKETRNYDLMPNQVYKQAEHYQCKSIAYTYSEPIAFYEYFLDSSKIAHEHGMKNVMVSAGHINEKPLREVAKYIDAANIDLKSFDDDLYARLNAGKLQPILDTLKILKEEGVWLEITNLIVPEWTDNLDMIKQMCDWLYKKGFENTPIHFSRFTPLYKLTHLPSTPVGTLKKAKEIAENAGLNYVYIGNVPGSDAQNTICPKCKKNAIERKGYRILQNNIVNGKCKSCNTSIAGVWD
ncbi:AmmeMemoRadiSam system radical SAM enzyme [Bacteroidota bacterium]